MQEIVIRVSWLNKLLLLLLPVPEGAKIKLKKAGFSAFLAKLGS